MFGSFKRLPRSMVSERKDPEPKKDKAFIIVLLFFAAIIIFSLICGRNYDVTKEQIRNLKISAFDILVFLTAAAGYYIAKKRRKK